MNTHSNKTEYPKIYETLKGVGAIMIALAIIGLIVGLFLAFSGYEEEVQIGISIIISAIVIGLSSTIFYAIAESIKLLTNIEFNTRTEKVEVIDHQQKTVSSNINEISLEDWKNKNPKKSLNDYYLFISKKKS